LCIAKCVAFGWPERMPSSCRRSQTMFRTGCRLLPPLLLAACVTTAQAQSWPERPVRFISSQAAGNGTDIIARFVAEQLGRRIGQPVIVENRPGGGNVVGAQA